MLVSYVGMICYDLLKKFGKFQSEGKKTFALKLNF